MAVLISEGYVDYPGPEVRQLDSKPYFQLSDLIFAKP